MSEDQRIRLAVIIGSVREGRFGPTAGNWFAKEARQHEGFDVDLIDLADHNALPTTLSRSAEGTAEMLESLSPRLAEADAFVVITPEYNHSYPAGLKNLIDWHYSQWQAKPVGFVSYGGLAGGLRAVEHLRAVFAELHAVTVRDTVSFHGTVTNFEEDGEPKDAAACNAAAKVLLDHLAWWAIALRDARQKQPYPA
jgi:NAD(P)H-dependent FMN reductase